MVECGKDEFSWFPQIYCLRFPNRHSECGESGDGPWFERSDYPLDSCRDILKNDVVTVLGYGPQGRGQSLNLKDNGITTILGLRKG